MPIIELTEEQVKTMTASEIAAAVTSAVTDKSKKELVEKITGLEDFADAPIVKHRKDGQVESQLEIWRDIDTAEPTRYKFTTWDYCEKSGEIQFIRIRHFDAAGEELEKDGLEIEHFLDRQPVTRQPKPLSESPFKPVIEKSGYVASAPAARGVPSVLGVLLCSQWTWDHVFGRFLG